MKFARQLQETQVPEWRRAYIDYRGLKKCVSAMRHEQELPKISGEVWSPSGGVPSHSENKGDTTSSPLKCSGSQGRHGRVGSASEYQEAVQHPADSDINVPVVHHKTSRKWSLASRKSARPSEAEPSRKSQTFDPILPLQDLLAMLTPCQHQFFEILDNELSKVEAFYRSQVSEMRTRSSVLRDQIQELNVHQDLWTATHGPEPRTIRARLNGAFDVPSALKIFRDRRINTYCTDSHSPGQDNQNCPDSSEPDQPNTSGVSHPELDPDDYLRAKRKLERAVLEHYRALVILSNYRVSNMEGFRKILKKFEKVTKANAQGVYMSEKVRQCAFASETSLNAMIKKMEESFAAQFPRGGLRQALKHLRAAPFHHSHHFSTFRSGVLLGSSVPALIAGLSRCFQETTRAAIPGWDGLLIVYAVFMIPVVSALLIGLNLLVWSHFQINYPFIFDLNTKTKVDSRKFFEIPSLLFATLSCAFWLSFSRIGLPAVAPTTWPLIWLGMAVCVMIVPLPVLSRPSRFWLHRSMARLLLPGLRSVEFRDFWLGDQLCSFVFSLSNLYIVGCAYACGFDHRWQRCSATSRDWVVPFVLASLPFLIRTVQSLRRYHDSKLVNHLINGGKYATGIFAHLLFFLWRHRNYNHRGTFVLWCLLNTAYSVYASAWDLLMDWSVLRTNPRHPLLREDLLYPQHLYYLGIVTNVLIRFAWVLYIPGHGLAYPVRSFIAAMLEILRRWQWNFYRVENEHLGNMDQYRATREVPLPYHIDHDEDALGNGAADEGAAQSWVGSSGLRNRAPLGADDDDSQPI